MSIDNIALMAHLMRRAGFTATRDELEEYCSNGYENTVEDLLYPGEPGNMPDDIIRRYHVDMSELRFLYGAAAYWMYRMITTKNSLEEKITLFWHSLFATGYAKLNQGKSHLNQIDTFRRHGLGNFAKLLVELSKDPAMIFWLDNNDSHKESVNENYGRELLELFAMGIGNYTEQDVKECARSFTGWTLGNAEYMAMRATKDSIWPYGRVAWHFAYRENDHDHGIKTFLGETGRFNGEDIIDIIAQHEATARFISTRLFQFFAADEVDEYGKHIVEDMVESYFASGYEIRSVLRTLFNSNYFKSDRSRHSRVKCPVEQMVGVIRIAGSYRTPTFGMEEVAQLAMYMGQGLLDPPSVEGWHEGVEWVDSGALVERINFAAKELGNVESPGIRFIIERLSSRTSDSSSPVEFVDDCIDLVGPFEISPETRSALIEHVSRDGNVNLSDYQHDNESVRRVGELLSLIASTREFQLA